MTEITLRAWQAKFARQLAGHRRDDFLLVACPAAGKTIAAAAAVAPVMAKRDCDQLVVVCPTVVVRDQWATVLGELGYRMLTDFHGTQGWPEHVHGVCATYAQVAMRSKTYARLLQQRRTVAICDEIHHAGEQKAWGDGLAEALAGATLRLMLSGTPFRSDGERIPFLTYADDGMCVPQFVYDYPRAVRDGVCRSIEFRAHNGRITWRGAEDDEPFEGTFKTPVTDVDRGRRLRASLDPSQPYLAAMLADAHHDLLQLRKQVPDAAGLVVCDSQAHAMEIDDLLSEVTGGMSALAISDMPRAHDAIRQFATSRQEWLVSVRMVAEGVDIPRLGVIAWCTASKTELMVRQVAGRALRGRGDHAKVPAIVHMPADPLLIRYANRLDVLGGVTLRLRGEHSGQKAKQPARYVPTGRVKEIAAAPLAGWIEKHERRLGGMTAISQMLRFDSHDAWTRLYYRWRHPNPAKGEFGNANVFHLWDYCQMLGAPFEDLYGGDEYAAAREYLETAGMGRDTRNRAIDAQPTTAPATVVAPALPEATVVHAAPERVEIETPVLPPSPEDIAAAEHARKAARAELFRLLGVYTAMRRAVAPVFQLASAHKEMTAACGPINADSDDEAIAAAIEWTKGAAARFAAAHPEQVRAVAREQRRLRVAASRAVA